MTLFNECPRDIVDLTRAYLGDFDRDTLAWVIGGDDAIASAAERYCKYRSPRLIQYIGGATRVQKYLHVLASVAAISYDAGYATACTGKCGAGKYPSCIESYICAYAQMCPDEIFKCRKLNAIQLRVYALTREHQYRCECRRIQTAMHLDLPQLLTHTEIVALALTRIPEIEQCRCIEWFARCLRTGRGSPDASECRACVDPLMRDRAGQTPLMYAASTGNETTVRALVPMSDVNAVSRYGVTALYMLCVARPPKWRRESYQQLCDSLSVLRQLLRAMSPDAIRARVSSGYTAFAALVINRPRLALHDRAIAVCEFLEHVPDAFRDTIPLPGHARTTVALRAAASNPAILFDQRIQALHNGVSKDDRDPAGVSIVDYVLNGMHADYDELIMRRRVAAWLRRGSCLAPDSNRVRYAACQLIGSGTASGFSILDRSIATLLHSCPMFSEISPYVAQRAFES